MASTQVETVSAFFTNVCNTCKKSSANLKRCAACKVVGYCSKDHQIADWKTHKTTCQALVTTNLITPSLPVNGAPELYGEYRLKKKFFMEMTLGRNLTLAEAQMCMFPRVCQICFSTENLKDCTDCGNVAYCCDEHKLEDKSRHSKCCADLALCQMLDCFFSSVDYTYDRITIPKITTDQFPSNILELYKLLELFKYNSYELPDEIWYNIAADGIVFGANIIYALEKSKKITNRRLNNSNELYINVVGAGKYDGGMSLSNMELIFHWIKNVYKIRLNLIGPNVPPINAEYPFCKQCKKKTFVVASYKQRYEDVCKSLHKPSIVVLFNSGLHEFANSPGMDTWKNALEYLVQNKDVPVLLTAYNMEEVKEDMGRLLGVGKEVEVVLDAMKNPFASPKPFRECEGRYLTVFHAQEVVAIVKRRI